MNKPKVFILTACHNEKSRISLLLKDLSLQDYPNIQVVVVDDGSKDKTAEYIKSQYPKAKLLTGNGNLWWTGSLAKGVKWILSQSNQNDYIITINADRRIGTGFVQIMVKVSQANPRTVIGSIIRDIRTNKLSDAAVHLNWKTGKYTQDLDIKNKELISSDVLSTKGTIFPVSLFREIGNFDAKRLPHYLSDYEFSLRAFEHGYSLSTAASSVVRNDTARTGLGDIIPRGSSIKTRWQLLFDRRSRQNIIDHYYFIMLHAPNKYKLQNLAIIIVKSLYILLWPYI